MLLDELERCRQCVILRALADAQQQGELSLWGQTLGLTMNQNDALLAFLVLDLLAFLVEQLHGFHACCNIDWIDLVDRGLERCTRQATHDADQRWDIVAAQVCFLLVRSLWIVLACETGGFDHVGQETVLVCLDLDFEEVGLEVFRGLPDRQRFLTLGGGLRRFRSLVLAALLAFLFRLLHFDFLVLRLLQLFFVFLGHDAFPSDM